MCSRQFLVEAYYSLFRTRGGKRSHLRLRPAHQVKMSRTEFLRCLLCVRRPLPLTDISSGPEATPDAARGAARFPIKSKVVMQDRPENRALLHTTHAA
jgi:hypothetical protein